MKLTCAVIHIGLIIQLVQCTITATRRREEDTTDNGSLPDNPDLEKQRRLMWSSIWNQVPGIPQNCCHLPKHLQNCACCKKACFNPNLPQYILEPLPHCCHLPKPLVNCQCCPEACQIPQFLLPLRPRCCHLEPPGLNCNCCPEACPGFVPIPPPPSPIPPNCCHLERPFVRCDCCPTACEWPSPVSSLNTSCCQWPKFLQHCGCCVNICKDETTAIPPTTKANDCCNSPKDQRNCSCCPSLCKIATKGKIAKTTRKPKVAKRTKPTVATPKTKKTTTVSTTTTKAVPTETTTTTSKVSAFSCCHLPQELQNCKCCPKKCRGLLKVDEESCCNWPRHLQRCDCCPNLCNGAPLTLVDKRNSYDCCHLDPEEQNCDCCPDAPICTRVYKESCCHLPPQKQSCHCCSSKCANLPVWMPEVGFWRRSYNPLRLGLYNQDRQSEHTMPNYLDCNSAKVPSYKIKRLENIDVMDRSKKQSHKHSINSSSIVHGHHTPKTVGRVFEKYFRSSPKKPVLLRFGSIFFHKMPSLIHSIQAAKYYNLADKSQSNAGNVDDRTLNYYKYHLSAPYSIGTNNVINRLVPSVGQIGINYMPNDEADNYYRINSGNEEEGLLKFYSMPPNSVDSANTLENLSKIAAGMQANHGLNFYRKIQEKNKVEKPSLLRYDIPIYNDFHSDSDWLNLYGVDNSDDSSNNRAKAPNLVENGDELYRNNFESFSNSYGDSYRPSDPSAPSPNKISYSSNKMEELKQLSGTTDQKSTTRINLVPDYYGMNQPSRRINRSDLPQLRTFLQTRESDSAIKYVFHSLSKLGKLNMLGTRMFSDLLNSRTSYPLNAVLAKPRSGSWPVSYGTRDDKEVNAPDSPTLIAKEENSPQVIVILSQYTPFEASPSFNPYLRPPLGFPVQYCAFNELTGVCEQNQGGTKQRKSGIIGDYDSVGEGDIFPAMPTFRPDLIYRAGIGIRHEIDEKLENQKEDED